MRLALRPYVTVASVVVVGAGLIYVTPVAAPHTAQRAVELAATEALSDLVGPIEAGVNSLGGLSGELSGMLPNLGDLSGTFADAASSQTILELLDPAFWQQSWNALLDPNAGEGAWLMLTGAIEELSQVSEAFLFASTFWTAAILESIWQQIAQALGLQSYAAAAEGLGTGLQGVVDAGLAGGIDPAVPAGVSTALGEVAPLFSDAAGMFDATTLVQDVSTALDPSALTSVLDISPIADFGTLLSTSTLPDLGEILTTLMP